MSLATAHEASRSLAAGTVTSSGLVESYLDHIRTTEPRLHAMNAVLEESALAAAKASDERRRNTRPLSPFDGIPVAVKDNICLAGAPTTCSSRILQNFKPPFNATVVERMAKAGLIPIAKTNLDEFAMGSSTENSAFGPSRNPWNTDCVPGGSSGGSAVAVAAGQAPWSLGSDTGGSIRQPASHCGIVGVKPTYGRVSRFGLVAFASSLDQIGPMTLDVEDAAALLSIIAGKDPRDSTSADVPVPDYRALLQKGEAKGLRIGRPREYFSDSSALHPDVASATNAALARLESLGATIVDVEMPHSEYAIATYYLVATAEASSNLARYDGAHYGHRTPKSANIVEMFSKTRAEGFGAEVKRRIMLGTFALAAETYDAYYLRALKVRTLIKRDYDEAFKKCDLIAAPTAPTPAFKFGEKTDDPLQMYLSDIFTLSLNLAGYCGIALPVGFSQTGLPIGLQLFAGAFEEVRLLQTAWHLEKALGVAGSRVPGISAGGT